MLGTTLTAPQFSIAQLKSLYHKRWGIEEFFKRAKHTYKIENFHSRSTEGVKQELWIMLLCSLLTKTIEHVCQQDCRPKNKKISSLRKHNQRVLKEVFVEKILPHLFDSGKKNVHIQGVLKIIPKLMYRVRKNRHFERFSKRPESRWRVKDKKNKLPRSLAEKAREA